MKKIKKNQLKTVSMLFPYMKNHRNWLIINGISSFFYAGLSVAISIIVQYLTDYALNDYSHSFIYLIYVTVTIVILYAMMSYVENYSKERFNMLTIEDIQNEAINTLQQLPLSYIGKIHSGDIVSRLNNDTTSISNLLKNILELFYQPLVFIGAFIYLFIISPKLLLSGVVLIPISAYVFNKISKPIQKKTKELMEQEARINSMSQDTLNGMHVVKSFNLQDQLLLKYQTHIKYAISKSLEIQKLRMWTTPIFLILRFIPQLVIPLYGGYLAMLGEISIGELLAANVIIWMVFRPVESFLSLLQQIRSGIPAVGRVFGIINHEKETYDLQEKLTKKNDLPIQFNHIYFSYEVETDFLKDIHFTLEKGLKIALVGPSGSGKSTLLKLIIGFCLPQRGTIELYGNKTSDSSISEVRSNLSYVSQDAHIYPDTVFQNIMYGNINATKDEVISAAKSANAHDFIMDMPLQYDTIIGKEGNMLSGGQRQRISIARALLKNAPILLLDEATSALDNESENLVTTALDNIMKDKSVLVVAHRLSTIQNADLILVMNQGEIIQRGTHEALINEEGMYKKLYQKQMMLSKGVEMDV